MSRRNKPRTHARSTNLALPIIIFGAILIVAAVLILGRPVAEAGTPRLVVDQQRIDYGYVKFGETRAIQLSVTNAGDGVLRFKKKPYIEVLEGC